MRFKYLFTNLLAAFLIFTFGQSAATAAEFSARLDRTQVVEGDPVVLTLTASGNGNGTPDYSVLQADFDLLSQGQSNQFSIINGQTSSSREWHLTLMPKRSGEITIPSIAFGNGRSKPLTLEVLPASQAAQQGIPRPVVLEAEIEPEQPYVQQQLIYTVRVLHALPLRDANLSEPRIDNALVRPLGQERRFETYRNGRQFQAIERRYAVFPQRSGRLTIGGPVLTARVPDPGQQQGNGLRDRFFGRDPFAGLGGMFGQTRPVQVRAVDSSVDVRPQPPGSPQPWLPAESLSITEQWSPEPSAYRVGEPMTRTVTIRARGLSDEQLPEPDIGAGIDANAYPDQPQAQTQTNGDVLMAQKVIKTAIVPTRVGELRIPALEIAWWDVENDQARVARLPARTLQVAAGAGTPTGNQRSPLQAQPAYPPATGPVQATSGSDRSRPNASAGSTVTGDGDTHSQWGLWPWLTLLFAVAWMMVSWLWWRERRRPAAAQQATQSGAAANPARPQKSTRRQQEAIRNACRENDPRAARQALIAWAEQRWPEHRPTGLEQLASSLGEESQAVFDVLNKHLYGHAHAPWDGDSAWTMLKPLIERSEARIPTGKPSAAALPPLYPSTG
jgi:hypothetical protein